MPKKYPTHLKTYEEWCKFYEENNENKDILFQMHRIGYKHIERKREQDRNRYYRQKEEASASASASAPESLKKKREPKLPPPPA